MFAAFALALFASTSSVPQDSKQDIVVVGRAIQTAKDSLAACLARRCAPNEDIDATLALAESQLVAGKYRDARSTLLKSLGRNKKQGDAYPIPVSDLYRANGRVAASLGIDNDFNRSTWAIYRTLKHGLPDSRDRHYSALMEVAEMLATTRNHERARLYYERIADQARADGRPDIAALAELRMTLRHLPPYMREARVKKIAYSTDPQTKAAQLEARLALARIAYEEKNVAEADNIVASLGQFTIKKPILVYAPPWDLASAAESLDYTAAFGADSTPAPTVADEGGRAGASGGGVAGALGPSTFASSRMALNVEDMWIDVGFQITPEGRVADLQVLRRHGNIGWAKPLLASIGGRRYTPAVPGSPTAYRRERYTFTSGLAPGAGTKMAQHSPTPRVEYFDLSDISAAN
jgi:tetratricopeptide (TPR) repeat protein